MDGHTVGGKSARTVSTLVCRDHVPMALDCLGAFARLCEDPICFRIHDDGTLSDADCDRLIGAINNTEIIRRKTADERAVDECSNYKAILDLRTTFPLMLKAFDTALWCDEPIYAFLDSDVLFLKRFTSPFRLPESKVNAIFMRDREPSYSLRSWGKVLHRHIRLPAKANTGMVVCHRDTIDFDFLDWFVRQPLCRAIPAMVEQTFWAALGQRIGCAVFDPRQARVMREGENDEMLVAGHFTARSRHLLFPYMQRSAKRIPNDESPVTLQIIAPGECTALDLARYELRRVGERIARWVAS